MRGGQEAKVNHRIQRGKGKGREPISTAGGWENRTQAVGRSHCIQNEPHTFKPRGLTESYSTLT